MNRLLFASRASSQVAEVCSRQPCAAAPGVMRRQFGAGEIRHFCQVIETSCWSCGEAVKTEGFFCGCDKNVVLPVDPARDYFSVLGCKRSFTLHTGELQKSFRKLQAQLHPDKFSNEPKQAQEYSADQSSLINIAFQTLSAPLPRGLYMLEQANMAVEEGTTSMDQTFLMHVMDLNDSLDQIETEEDLKEFLPQIQDLIESCTQKAAEKFAQSDLEAAREQICQLKYFANLRQRANDKLLAVDIAS